jgi:hypothetical protein
MNALAGTHRLLRWETMLAAVLVAEFVLFASISPYFLDVNTLSDATFNFTERAIVALPPSSPCPRWPWESRRARAPELAWWSAPAWARASPPA